MPIFNAKLFEEKPELLRGNLQIIACAGSGKTQFVSERIAYQIYKGIAIPEQIVAFTFTDKAAEELKFRTRAKIHELMGKQPDIGDMYIGTIHAFAYRLIQEFIPKYRAYEMLDEVRNIAFLRTLKKDLNYPHLEGSLIKRFKKPPYGTNIQSWVFNTFLKDVNIYREERLTPKQAVTDSFKKAYEVYINKLEEKRYLDFSGILRIIVDAMQSEENIRKKIQSQYKFCTVDEYQDVNPIQEELIQLLSNKSNVCVVGDDDQSIYQWRGANVENILTFRKRYPKTSVHLLDINRRSTDLIVKSSSEFIEKNNPKRLKKDIKGNDLLSQPGDLYKILFKKQDEEVEWIITKIKSLVGKEFYEEQGPRKLKYSDVALFFRSVRNKADVYIEALKASGIPVIYAGIGGLINIEEINIIIRIFEYICNCDKKVKYNDEFLTDIHNNMEKLFSLSYKKFKEGVCDIQTKVKSQKRLSLQGAYMMILNLLGLSDEKMHDNQDDVLLYNLGRFSQAISDYEGTREYLTYKNITDFIWFLRLHAEKAYDSGNTDGMSGLVDAVQVMTMHGTKGLGFPVVFMPSHFGQNKKPNFGTTFLDVDKFESERFLNSIEDERRLYYVAMTRAKKFLFITSAEYKIENKRRSEHKILFDEIPKKYFLTEPVEDPTKRNDCKIERVSEDLRLPTSYSELAYYLNCGYDYKIRFIYGFNPELVPALGFGKQIHNIINILHKQFEKTKKIPSKSQIHKIIEDNFYLRHASSSITERLKIGAIKSVSKYIELWEKDFSLSVKTERAFEYDFNNALISGSIDMIKRNDSDENVLEVIDFKTGKPENDLMHRYELQVQLYTIAAQEALGINTQNALIHFIDSDKNSRLAVQTSGDALKTAKEEIGFAIDGITKAVFNRDARQNRTCKECDWCNMCPKRKGFKND